MTMRPLTHRTLALAGVFTLFAIVGLASVSRIASLQCFFHISWPWCSEALDLGQTILQTVLIVLFAGAGALFWKRLFMDSESIQKISANKIIGVGVVLSVMLVFALPFTSNDLSYYYSVGEAVHGKLNPYVDEWENSIAFVEGEPRTTNALMYGPVMPHIFGALYSASNGSLVLFSLFWKIAMLMVFGIIGLLLWYIGKKDKKIILGLFLLQPLVLWEWIGAGHFDGLWLIFVLLAYLFAKRNQWWLVLIALTCGIWIKLIPLLMLPWFILWWWQETNKSNWKMQFGHVFIGLGVSLKLTMLLWSNFWRGPEVFHGIALQTKWAVHSLFAATYYNLSPIAELLLADRAHWFLTRAVQGSLLLAAVYLLYPLIRLAFGILFKKVRLAPHSYLLALFSAMLVYLLVWQKSLWPWYFGWFIPVGLLLLTTTTSKYLERILLWIGAVPLFFYIPQAWFGLSAPTPLFFLLSFLIMGAYPLWQLARWRKEGYSIEVL